MRKLLAAFLLLLPLATCRADRRGSVSRVMVMEGPAWTGLPPKQRQGLRMLVEDLAETSGATVITPPPGDGPPPKGVLCITLEGARSGASLRFQGHLQTAGGSRRDVVPPSPDPCSQLLQILDSAGLHASGGAAILPRDATRLLALAETYANALEGLDEESFAAQGPASALMAQEPGCAPASLAYAQSACRHLLTQPAAGLDAQMVSARGFDTALLLLPGFPRAARYAGRFYTDTGNQRRALELLFQAEALWPASPGPRVSLAYAARTTGLLDRAQAALLAKDRLDGGQGARESLPEATYLYLGQWDRFEACLGPGPSERPHPEADFYRGYLRLLQGRREEAAESFRGGARPFSAAPQFQSLSHVYELALAAKRPEALLILRNLASSRAGLRVPDGEFTFKLAEAFGFLGAQDEAMDMAQLAFSQGFGCTAWYLRSPMLAPLHELPRWRALISHLQERQRLIEAQFPAQAFGPSGA